MNFRKSSSSTCFIEKTQILHIEKNISSPSTTNAIFGKNKSLVGSFFCVAHVDGFCRQNSQKNANIKNINFLILSIQLASPLLLIIFYTHTSIPKVKEINLKIERKKFHVVAFFWHDDDNENICVMYVLYFFRNSCRCGLRLT